MSNLAVSNFWDSADANEIAREITLLAGVYCGPAAVGWIAAVWNARKGRPYDYVTRLKDKDLFPDGPVPFTLHLPGFNISLSELLRRETNNELQLSGETYYRYSTVHDSLQQFEMPIVVRMLAPKLRDGLHYVTVYKSERKLSTDGRDRIRLSWHDNGLMVSNYQRDGGRINEEQRSVGISGFVWGAKRVVEV